jgi:hypothetical protein
MDFTLSMSIFGKWHMNAHLIVLDLLQEPAGSPFFERKSSRKKKQNLTALVQSFIY